MYQTPPTVAIVGLGQLGVELARRLPAERLLLVSRSETKAAALAKELPGAAAAPVSRISEADLVFLAVPANEVVSLYREQLAPRIRPDAVLVNTATLVDTAELRAVCPDHRWIPLKLIGSAKALQAGRSALLVTDDEEHRALLEPLVSKLGRLIAGDERWVLACNTIATKRALEAGLRIAEDIRQAGLPAEFAAAAQAVVGAGVLQSFADGTLGHFGKAVLRDLEAERNEASAREVK